MTLADAVGLLAPRIPAGTICIHANGYVSRAGYAARDREECFYMIGSMGLAASIGLGLALARRLARSASGDIARTIYLHPSAREEFQRLMERDGLVREFEYQVRGRNGDILWLSDSATVVRDEKGEAVRYEGTVRDITDQRRAEDASALYQTVKLAIDSKDLPQATTTLTRMRSEFSSSAYTSHLRRALGAAT